MEEEQINQESLALSESEEQEVALVDVSDVETNVEVEASQIVEESNLETDEVTEESAFLQQWKKRHEAHLAKQTQQEVELSDEEIEKVTALETIVDRGKLKQTILSSHPQKPTLSPKKDPIPKTIVWRTIPVYVLSTLILLISLYFVTPLGKWKQFSVEGNQELSSDTIIKKSLISSNDYALTTLLHHQQFEENIKSSSPWIKSAKIRARFPNHFLITVEEYTQIGYVKQGEEYYSVLSNGEVSDTPTSADSLPEKYTTIQLSDKELIKELVLHLASIDPGILSSIQDIQLTPSKATNDLLSIEMRNGNLVLVPLNEVEFKLPYYKKIASDLMTTSVIDMEVGIYSYARVNG
ncbi:cell division protein FtsQ/DivIB [Streptococcus cameli]